MPPAKPIILIVDDEPDLRELMDYHVQAFGYPTRLAASGNEALEIVRQKPIKIVVTDIRMPDGTGVELLGALRKIDPVWPRVFFVTGHADIKPGEAFDLGAEAYFNKPINYDVLEVALAESLEPLASGFPHRQVRVKLDAAVELVHDGQAFTGELHNFTGRGMFVRLDPTQLSLDSSPINFAVTFKSPALAKVHGECLAKWVRPQREGDHPVGVGLVFTDLPPRAKQQLDLAYNAARTSQELTI